MKIWQLSAIVGQAGIIERVAATLPIWRRYKQIYVDDYTELVQTQNRAVLDSTVDHEFATAVLSQMKLILYLSSDNTLRSSDFDTNATALTVLQAFERYGGSAVEECLEKGSVKVA